VRKVCNRNTYAARSKLPPSWDCRTSVVRWLYTGPEEVRVSDNLSANRKVSEPPVIDSTGEESPYRSLTPDPGVLSVNAW
jgi:hypothetical protein